VRPKIPLARLVRRRQPPLNSIPLLARVLESIKLADPFDPEDDERLLRRLRDATIVTLSTEATSLPR